MGGERDVAVAVPRQRRVREMADGLAQRPLVITFSDRCRQLDARDVDPPDKLSGLQWFRRSRYLCPLGRGPICRDHLIDVRFGRALITPRMDRSGAVKNEAGEAKRNE